MNFNKTLNEAGAGHATTADFWTDKGVDRGQYVRFNGKVMTLKQFLMLSSKDSDAKKIIDKIKQSRDYRGSIGDFIANLLKDNDGITDLSIKKGGVFFDKNEIERNKNPKPEEKHEPKKSHKKSIVSHGVEHTWNNRK